MKDVLPITRRAVIGALSLSAVPRANWAESRLAPKRDHLSVSVATARLIPVEIPWQTTFMVSLPFETSSTMFRIGYANVFPISYGIQAACCRQVSDQNASEKDWKYFSFAGAPGITIPGQTREMQPMAPTGSKFAHMPPIPHITWSDWLHYEASLSDGRPRMEFRTLVPAQTIAAVKILGRAPIHRPSQTTDVSFIEYGMAPGDYVTSRLAPAPWTQAHASPLYVIQYKSSVPGIQIVMGGDSHLAMRDSFVKLAASDLSKPSLPISVWNAAWAGASSNNFWPMLDETLAAANPSISVIQGWTANDGMTAGQDNAYLARVAESAKRTQNLAGIPIILKGLPRHLYGKPELDSWLSINKRLDNLLPGAVVFDPNPYVEAPTQPGNWMGNLSADGIHPNPAGNEILRVPFERCLARLIF